MEKVLLVKVETGAAEVLPRQDSTFSPGLVSATNWLLAEKPVPEANCCGVNPCKVNGNVLILAHTGGEKDTNQWIVAGTARGVHNAFRAEHWPYVRKQLDNPTFTLSTLTIPYVFLPEKYELQLFQKCVFLVTHTDWKREADQQYGSELLWP